MCYYNKALKKYKEINYKKGIANTLNKIGILFLNKADYKQALNYFLQKKQNR